MESDEASLYSDSSELQLRDIVNSGDGELYERRPENDEELPAPKLKKKKKNITRTDIIYNELIAEPLKGHSNPTSLTKHRFALCEYAIMMPIILVTIGNVFYLIGYLYEKFFFDSMPTTYYGLLFEGWIVIMLFCSLTLGIKACQMGLNIYCCRRR
jgi:hypothetical protein